MELYILRHAIAENRIKYLTKFSNDDQRPLSVIGEKKFKNSLPCLKKILGPVDWVISSPLLRAKQTSDILSNAYPQIQNKLTDTLLPAAHPFEFAQWFNTQFKNKKIRVVIVGHEPHLSRLACWLLFGSTDSRIIIKKGGCVALSFEQILGPASGSLKWALTPKILKIKTK